MILSLIVAVSENNAIGKSNQLLWHLPNDMKFFKNITWAMPVVMGRKTFESLGSKPLHGRLNMVITRQHDFSAEGIFTVANMNDAIFLAHEYDYNEMMIIGGGEIYKHVLPRANKIYLTRVHAIFEDADTFFPVIKENEWELVSNKDFDTDEKHAYGYSFQLWQRK